METTITPYKNCDLLTVSGRVDSLTAPQLGEALKTIFQGEKFDVIIDLKQVNYVSSAGLRVLIDAQKTSKPHGGQIILMSVPQRIFETLELAGLTALFRIEDNLTGIVGA